MAKGNKIFDHMLTSEEINETIEQKFNPVKSESNRSRSERGTSEDGEPPKESEVKKELPYDRARLEFLRITIGPVQNFYTTLGNILLSISERLAKVEDRLYAVELKDKMHEEYALLIASEGRFVSMEEFKLHWEKLEKEKASENKKH